MSAHVFVTNEVATAANLNTLLPPAMTQSGVLKMTPIANTPTSVQVTFPVPFSSAPVVVVTGYTSAIGVIVKGVGVTNVTATGFTLWVYRTNTTNTTVGWQAWGAPAGVFTDGDPLYASTLSAAQASPTRAQSGQGSITPSAANAATSKSFTFPTAFSATPVVVACLDTIVPGTALGVSVTDVTTSGFTAWITRTNTTTTFFEWMALGRP